MCRILVEKVILEDNLINKLLTANLRKRVIFIELEMILKKDLVIKIRMPTNITKPVEKWDLFY